MNKTVRLIARFALSAALIVTGFTVDKLLSMPLPINLAVTVLLMTLVLCQSFDFATALWSGFVFGMVSWIYAFLFPNASSPAFMKPWVSVLPRIVVGITCYWSYRGLKRLFSRFQNPFAASILPRALSGAVGVLTNTLLVLSMLALFNSENVVEKVIAVIVTLNFGLEICVGAVLVPIVSAAVEKPLRRMKI